MRIVGGTWRRRRLTPLGKGAPADHLRPTSDRVRESLFNVIEHSLLADGLAGTRVLDLFAGTGALGLEALSRGAVYACFCEQGRAGQQMIAANIELLGAQEVCRLLTMDATRLGPNSGEPFDLVFLDPPYGKGLGERALTGLDQSWLAPNALVVWEEADAMPAPERFRQIDTRRYGDTHITVLEAS